MNNKDELYENVLIRNTQNIDEIAVQIRGSNLQYIEYNKRSKFICELVFETCGDSWEYKPDRLRYNDSWEYIPFNCLTECMVLKIFDLRNDEEYQMNNYYCKNWNEICSNLLLELPPENLTQKIVNKFFDKVKFDMNLLNCKIFNQIPNIFKDEYVCNKLIENSSNWFPYVPENFKTESLCEKAVKKNGIIIHYVPDVFKTMKMCKSAIKQDGRAVKFVPPEIQTECIHHVIKYHSLDYVKNEK